MYGSVKRLFTARVFFILSFSFFFFLFSPFARADTDADVVLLFPAADAAEETELLSEAGDWITEREGEGLSVVGLSLYTILDYYGYPSGTELSAEEIRLYLKDNFTHRTAGESEMGRYLFLVSSQNEEAGALYPVIPRYQLTTNLNTVETDSPYGFITQETLDGGDGIVDVEDLDLEDPGFVLF